jgi:hypothetical protein
MDFGKVAMKKMQQLRMIYKRAGMEEQARRPFVKSPNLTKVPS